MQNKKYESEINELYELLASLEGKEDFEILLEDLCTIKEVEQMALRVKAAKLLLEGKTYLQVIDECDISSATLSRVSKCVRYGNGYNCFLKKKTEEN